MTNDQKRATLETEKNNLELPLYKATMFAEALMSLGLKERAENVAKEVAELTGLMKFYDKKIAELK